MSTLPESDTPAPLTALICTSNSAAGSGNPSGWVWRAMRLERRGPPVTASIIAPYTSLKAFFCSSQGPQSLDGVVHRTSVLYTSDQCAPQTSRPALRFSIVPSHWLPTSAGYWVPTLPLGSISRKTFSLSSLRMTSVGLLKRWRSGCGG